MYVSGVLEGDRRVRNRKNIWSNSDWQFYKSDENYKTKNPRSSTHFKQKQHEEVYTMTYNQIS